MPKNETDNPLWFSLRLVEKFSNVIYPIDIPSLFRVLPNIGYIVPKKVLKGILEPGESLAIKGNIELILNQQNQTIGVSGKNVSEVVTGFTELRNFWLDQLKPCPPALTQYTELSGESVLLSSKNPTKVFGEFWGSFDGLKRVNKIVGLDSINFGITLVPKDIDPNGPDWFSFTIQPQIISSVNRYFITIAWRNSNSEKALSNFSKTNETILAIIKEVEKG